MFSPLARSPPRTKAVTCTPRPTRSRLRPTARSIAGFASKSRESRAPSSSAAATVCPRLRIDVATKRAPFLASLREDDAPNPVSIDGGERLDGVHASPRVIDDVLDVARRRVGAAASKRQMRHLRRTRRRRRRDARVAHRRAVQNPGRGFLRGVAGAESVVVGDAGASSSAVVDVLVDIGK